VKKIIGPKLGIGRSSSKFGNVSSQAKKRDVSPPGGGSSVSSRKFGKSAENRHQTNVEGQDSYDISLHSSRIENPINRRGFSDQKPEILSIINFLPIFNESGQINDSSGEKFRTLLQSSRLRQENIVQLIEDLLQNSNTRESVLNLENNFKDDIDLARRDLEILSSIYDVLSEGRIGLEIKDNKKILNKILPVSGREPKDARSLMVDFLGFSGSSFENFSNTKILLQIISDFNQIVKMSTPALFGEEIVDRVDDDHPFYIDTTLVDLTDKRLRLDELSFRSSGIDPVKRDDYGIIVDKMADSPENRIKDISALISKEIRFSTGLGKRATRNDLQRNFGYSPGDNPVESMFGRPRTSALEKPMSSNTGVTFSDLARLEVDNSPDIVLPFESRVIENRRSGKTYVPGYIHLINSIVESRAESSSFDTSNLENFSTTLKKVGEDISTLSFSLFSVVPGREIGLGGPAGRGRNSSGDELEIDENLSGRFILDTALEDIRKILSSMNTEGSSNNDDVILTSIISEANNDFILKHSIFLLIILQYLSNPWTNTGSPLFKSLDGPEKTKILSDLGVNDEVSGISKLKDRIITRLKRNYPISSGETNISNTAEARNQNFQNRTVRPHSVKPPRENSISNRSVKHNLFGSSRTRDEGRNENEDSPIGDTAEILGAAITESSIRDALSGGLMSSIMSLVATLDGSSVSDDGYLTSSGLTRFNEIKSSFIFMSIMELYFSLVGLYTENVFFTNNGNIRILVNARKISKSLDEISNKTGKYSSMISRVKDEDSLPVEILEFLLTISESVSLESRKVIDFFRSGLSMRDILRMSQLEDFSDRLLSLTNEQINLSKSILDDIESSYVRRLDNFQNNDNLFRGASLRPPLGGGDSPGKKDRFKNFNRAATVPPFTDDIAITANKEKMLMKVFESPEFRAGAGSNLQILSVGLPSKFTDNLRLKFSIGQSKFSVPRETDIVRVNVYRKDIEFDDITFKPKSYLFDMTRFVPRGDDIVDQGSDIISLDDIKTRSYRFGNQGRFRDLESSREIVQSSDYGLLSQDELKDIHKNHVISNAFENYIRIMSDADISEEAFLINETVESIEIDDQTRDEFNNLVLLHVSNIAKRKLTFEEISGDNSTLAEIVDKLLNNDLTTQTLSNTVAAFDDMSKSQNIQIAQDLVSFFRLFSVKSFIAGSRSRKNKIISPKIFERIFHIPVDQDDFIIDVELTNSTESGRSALEKASFENRIIRIPDPDRFESGDIVPLEGPRGNENTILKIKPRLPSEGQINLSEIFVTISSYDEEL